MTDLERLMDLLHDWGVPFERHPRREGGTSLAVENPSPDKHPKVTGYVGFVTEFEFDEHETFVKMGAWE